jgi:redox-sensing transcriptional repressor
VIVMATTSRGRRIPEATVARLPEYLRILLDLFETATHNVSSEELADLAGVNAAKVRKDLSYLGTYGTRGVGYEVEYLIYQVRRELGLTHDWPVVIVGAGNLGQALAGYGGFGQRGFPVAGIVDIDEAKVDTVIAGVRVRRLGDLPAIVAAHRVSIGVVATPGPAAQEAADLLVKAGVTSILNFAPMVLTVPSTVTVRKVDLAVELQILSYYEQRRAAANAAAAPRVPGGSRQGASA